MTNVELTQRVSVVISHVNCIKRKNKKQQQPLILKQTRDFLLTAHFLQYEYRNGSSRRKQLYKKIIWYVFYFKSSFYEQQLKY